MCAQTRGPVTAENHSPATAQAALFFFLPSMADYEPFTGSDTSWRNELCSSYCCLERPSVLGGVPQNRGPVAEASSLLRAQANGRWATVTFTADQKGRLPGTSTGAFVTRHLGSPWPSQPHKGQRLRDVARGRWQCLLRKTLCTHVYICTFSTRVCGCVEGTLGSRRAGDTPGDAAYLGDNVMGRETEAPRPSGRCGRVGSLEGSLVPW